MIKVNSQDHSCPDMKLGHVFTEHMATSNLGVFLARGKGKVSTQEIDNLIPLFSGESKTPPTCTRCLCYQALHSPTYALLPRELLSAS